MATNDIVQDTTRFKTQRRALLGDEDATMVFETSKGVDVVPTFDGMGLRENLIRGIYAYGMGNGRVTNMSANLFRI